MRDVYGRAGLGGSTDLLTVLDLATGFQILRSCGFQGRTWRPSVRLQFFRGDQPIAANLFWQSGFGPFQKACYHLGITWERSQPGDSRERMHALNVAAAISWLVREPSSSRGGLPSRLLALCCFFFFKKTTICTLVDGTSPWFKRHGDHFAGLSVPFGCGVHFIPAKHCPQQGRPSPAVGRIFVGYRLSPWWQMEWRVPGV